MNMDKIHLASDLKNREMAWIFGEIWEGKESNAPALATAQNIYRELIEPYKKENEELKNYVRHVNETLKLSRSSWDEEREELKKEVAQLKEQIADLGSQM